LARAYRLLGGAEVASEHAHRIARTRQLLETALAEALLVTADLAVAPSRLTPGVRADAVLTVATGELKAEVRGATLDAPNDWHIEAGEAGGTTWRFHITAPENAACTSLTTGNAGSARLQRASTSPSKTWTSPSRSCRGSLSFSGPR
jgi:hypothetical protein